jgi:hypothetical protein
VSSVVRGDCYLFVANCSNPFRSSEQKSEEDQYSLIVDGSNIIIQSGAPVIENYEIQQILPKEMMMEMKE